MKLFKLVQTYGNLADREVLKTIRCIVRSLRLRNFGFERLDVSLGLLGRHGDIVVNRNEFASFSTLDVSQPSCRCRTSSSTLDVSQPSNS